MKRNRIATLPPIAVEERPEKIALTLSPSLKRAIDAFTEYFTDTTGAKPTSDNAVIVGILTGYIEDHGLFNVGSRVKRGWPPRMRVPRYDPHPPKVRVTSLPTPPLQILVRTRGGMGTDLVGATSPDGLLHRYRRDDALLGLRVLARDSD